MDQWINKTKIDLYKVFWSYSEIYIYSIHFYYILITTKCESHIDCLLCFTSSVVIRLWKQLYTYNYNYIYCNWTKRSQLGEGDNPKINKSPLKNMVYYVVKHFLKYFWHIPVTTPQYTWSEVNHPKNIKNIHTWNMVNTTWNRFATNMVIFAHTHVIHTMVDHS